MNFTYLIITNFINNLAYLEIVLTQNNCSEFIIKQVIHVKNNGKMTRVFDSARH